MLLVSKGNIKLRNKPLLSGYASDDESSDLDEPHDSGRTRSSSRRTNQQQQESTNDNNSSSTNKTNQSNDASGNKGRKRKRITNQGGDNPGSDKDNDDDDRECGDRSRLKLDESQEKEDVISCCCPKNVMRCIGVLPSLPIISQFYEQCSDETDSSIEDLSHVTLPAVNRNPKSNEE